MVAQSVRTRGKRTLGEYKDFSGAGGGCRMYNANTLTY